MRSRRIDVGIGVVELQERGVAVGCLRHHHPLLAQQGAQHPPDVHLSSTSSTWPDTWFTGPGSARRTWRRRPGYRHDLDGTAVHAECLLGQREAQAGAAGLWPWRRGRRGGRAAPRECPGRDPGSPLARRRSSSGPALISITPSPPQASTALRRMLPNARRKGSECPRMPGVAGSSSRRGRHRRRETSSAPAPRAARTRPPRPPALREAGRIR